MASIHHGIAPTATTPEPGGPRTARTASATGFDLQPVTIGAAEILRILVRRRMVIALTMLAVVAGIGAYLLRATPLYTATVTMQVRTQDIAEAATGELRPVNPLDELRIATHMNLLGATPLAAMVAQDLDLSIDPEFARAPQRPWYSRILGRDETRPVLDADDAKAEHMAAVVERLLDRVKITRVGQSHLIDISVTTTDPEKSAAIANIFAGSHLKRLQKEAQAETERRIRETTLRAEELRQQAVDGERAAVAYGRERGLLGAAPGGGGQIDRLAAQLAEARAARAGAEIRNAGIALGGTASPLLNDLRAQLAGLDKRIAELAAQYGAGHPDMITARAQRDDVAARLAVETGRVQRDAAAEVAANRAREAQIAADLGQVRSQAVRAGEATVGVDDLQRSAEANRTLYLAQLALLQDLRSREKVIRPDITTVAKAIAPADPSEPHIGRILASGLVGGSMLALMLAFAAEMFDSRLRTADQVSRHLGLDTLAMMPELSRREMHTPLARMFVDNPTSVFVETARSLYMDLADRRRRGASLVITSPLPSDGKTLIAASLGAAAATLGRSAILVDFDLRRPAVLQALGMEASGQDIVDCLGGDIPLTDKAVAEAITANPDLPRLSVIGVNRPVADPAALLASPRVPELVALLRQRFDIVILNAPPILAVRDAKSLGALVDDTLLVIRWGRTTPDAARAACRILDGGISGAIISRVNYRRHAASRYGDQLQHYSDYSAYFGGATARS